MASLKKKISQHAEDIRRMAHDAEVRSQESAAADLLMSSVSEVSSLEGVAQPSVDEPTSVSMPPVAEDSQIEDSPHFVEFAEVKIVADVGDAKEEEELLSADSKEEIRHKHFQLATRFDDKRLLIYVTVAMTDPSEEDSEHSAEHITAEDSKEAETTEAQSGDTLKSVDTLKTVDKDNDLAERSHDADGRESDETDIEFQGEFSAKQLAAMFLRSPRVAASMIDSANGCEDVVDDEFVAKSPLTLSFATMQAAIDLRRTKTPRTTRFYELRDRSVRGHALDGEFTFEHSALELPQTTAVLRLKSTIRFHEQTYEFPLKKSVVDKSSILEEAMRELGEKMSLVSHQMNVDTEIRMSHMQKVSEMTIASTLERKRVSKLEYRMSTAEAELKEKHMTVSMVKSARDSQELRVQRMDERIVDLESVLEETVEKLQSLCQALAKEKADAAATVQSAAVLQPLDDEKKQSQAEDGIKEELGKGAMTATTVAMGSAAGGGSSASESDLSPLSVFGSPLPKEKTTVVSSAMEPVLEMEQKCSAEEMLPDIDSALVFERAAIALESHWPYRGSKDALVLTPSSDCLLLGVGLLCGKGLTKATVCVFKGDNGSKKKAFRSYKTQTFSLEEKNALAMAYALEKPLKMKKAKSYTVELVQVNAAGCSSFRVAKGVRSRKMGPLTVRFKNAKVSRDLGCLPCFYIVPL